MLIYETNKISGLPLFDNMTYQTSVPWYLNNMFFKAAKLSICNIITPTYTNGLWLQGRNLVGNIIHQYAVCDYCYITVNSVSFYLYDLYNFHETEVSGCVLNNGSNTQRISVRDNTMFAATGNFCSNCDGIPTATYGQKPDSRAEEVNKITGSGYRFVWRRLRTALCIVYSDIFTSF